MMRKGMEMVESVNNKIKGGDKEKMKTAISWGIIGIIVGAMLLASMASPALANESGAASAYTLRAFVYGDANEDRTIDMRDVTYIKLVIFKKKSETRLADANYDGKISMLDVGQTKLIVLGKQKQLTLLDMDDRAVTIPQPLERVVTLDNGAGFIPCIMSSFGVEDKIVGTGGSIYSKGGSSHSTGETPATFLVPEIKDLPDVGKVTSGTNYETLVGLEPEVVIMRKCAASQGSKLPMFSEAIEKLERFNIPLIVLNDQSCYKPPDVSTIYMEIAIVGEIFDKQEKAQKMINYLDEEVELVKERTRDIPDEEKPRVLYFGLVGGTSYGKGMVGLALPDYDCSTLFPDITNIKNAYIGDTRALMSSEQILAINPDVILLGCAPGGWKVNQLYEEEYYKDIQEVKAIKERRVYSSGRLEIYWNIAGLEYAIELMIEAKGAYPDRFEDVNVGELLAEHYKELFGISDDEVKEFKASMGLDWMDEQGF